jgi:hypothetical protein
MPRVHLRIMLREVYLLSVVLLPSTSNTNRTWLKLLHRAPDRRVSHGPCHRQDYNIRHLDAFNHLSFRNGWTASDTPTSPWYTSCSGIVTVEAVVYATINSRLGENKQINDTRRINRMIMITQLSFCGHICPLTFIHCEGTTGINTY